MSRRLTVPDKPAKSAMKLRTYGEGSPRSSACAMVAPISRESRSGLYQCGYVGCDGSHLHQAGSVACASKTRTPSKLRTSERCGLSQEKALTNGKNPALASRKSSKLNPAKRPRRERRFLSWTALARARPEESA
jgi:hypothetical protein